MYGLGRTVVGDDYRRRIRARDFVETFGMKATNLDARRCTCEEPGCQGRRCDESECKGFKSTSLDVITLMRGIWTQRASRRRVGTHIGVDATNLSTKSVKETSLNAKGFKAKSRDARGRCEESDRKGRQGDVSGRTQASMRTIWTQRASMRRIGNHTGSRLV